jgi:hypothetical protein
MRGKFDPGVRRVSVLDRVLPRTMYHERWNGALVCREWKRECFHKMKIQENHRHFVPLQIQALLSYAITARNTIKTNRAALAHHFYSDRNLKLRPVFTNYRNILPPLFQALIKTNSLSYGW